MKILVGYNRLLRELVLNVRGNGLKHTTCGSDADIGKLLPYLSFKLLLHDADRLCNTTDIMDLPVEHGSGLMLAHVLCNHDKFIVRRLVSNCSDYIACTNVQSKYITHLCLSLKPSLFVRMPVPVFRCCQ